MDDSNPVDMPLDDFEKVFFAKTPESAEEPAVVEEGPEPTPSATDEDNESEPKPDDASDEADDDEGTDGDDTPEEKEDDKEEAEKPQPKKRRSAQERINDLTREKYELQRLLDLERQERDRNKSPDKSEDKPTSAVTPTSTDAPDPDALNEDGTPVYPLGEYDKDFIADLTRFTFKQEREAAMKQETEDKLRKEAAAAEQELTNSWNAKVAASADRLPDLDTKFGLLQSTFQELPQDYGNFLASSIMTLENGPDVLAYLADNLDIAKQVVDSGAFGAVISLGRLDEKFSSDSEEVEKGVTSRVTQASPPPPKNKGSAVAKTIRGDTDNLDDFSKIFYQK
jgi:hypothetical protein